MLVCHSVMSPNVLHLSGTRNVWKKTGFKAHLQLLVQSDRKWVIVAVLSPGCAPPRREKGQTCWFHPDLLWLCENKRLNHTSNSCLCFCHWLHAFIFCKGGRLLLLPTQLCWHLCLCIFSGRRRWFVLLMAAQHPVGQNWTWDMLLPESSLIQSHPSTQQNTFHL